MAVTPFKSSDNFNMAGFNEKITEADNTYVAKTGGSMTGALSMGNNKITDVATPTNAGDVVNKGYLDEKSAFNKKFIDNITSLNTLSESTLQDILVAKGLICEYKISATPKYSSNASISLKISDDSNNTGHIVTLSRFRSIQPSEPQTTYTIEGAVFLNKTSNSYGSDNSDTNYIYLSFDNSLDIAIYEGEGYTKNKFLLSSLGLTSSVIHYCRLYWVM